MPKQNKFLSLFIISSIFTWTLITNSSMISKQYIQIPNYAKNKISNIINNDKVLGIGAYRWSNLDSKPIVTYGSKIYYNKVSLIFNEFWDFTDFFSPRFYFLAGDTTALTPNHTEPLITILFPFWIIGIGYLLKHNHYKIFLLIFIDCLFAYLIGQKNLIFLWPTLLAYAYIAIIGVQSLKNKLLKNSSYILIASYWIFILMRIIARK